MSEIDIFTLGLNGWVVECESPLEIFHEETGSRVSGKYAVQLILDHIEEYPQVEYHKPSRKQQFGLGQLPPDPMDIFIKRDE